MKILEAYGWYDSYDEYDYEMSRKTEEEAFIFELEIFGVYHSEDGKITDMKYTVNDYFFTDRDMISWYEDEIYDEIMYALYSDKVTEEYKDGQFYMEISMDSNGYVKGTTHITDLEKLGTSGDFTEDELELIEWFLDKYGDDGDLDESYGCITDFDESPYTKMNKYDEKALDYATKHHINKYSVDGNEMTYDNNFKYVVNLDTDEVLGETDD